MIFTAFASEIMAIEIPESCLVFQDFHFFYFSFWRNKYLFPCMNPPGWHVEASFVGCMKILFTLSREKDPPDNELQIMQGSHEAICFDIVMVA